MPGVCYVVLVYVAIAFVIVRVKPNSTNLSPTLEKPTHLTLDNSHYEKDEERGITDKVKSWLTMSKSAQETTQETTQKTLKQWAKDKQSPDLVFETIKRVQAADKLFENPLFPAWLEGIPEETLVKMLAAARQIPSTKDIATKLQNVMIQGWLKAEKSPDDLFNLLRLGWMRDLGNPSFNIWVEYMGHFATRFPTKAKSIIPTLVRLKGAQQPYVMLELAKKDPSTKALATRLRTEQMKTPWEYRDSVFKLFSAEVHVDDILTSPLFLTWTKYVKAQSPLDNVLMVSATRPFTYGVQPKGAR
ncbi:hypothetical protein PPTG_03393 [Phytophthora nicotianae INRA-310]|uniref:RxLR effector PexRD54 WY domain-containing protein n=1 Tax=Phytophthora nicotianae (strain INRA-310) TaxID=761204 RepID=W2R791_PHYN3|nr:hypothetical protein PPTG_03393 [Phytophthora nicotianae INRA-310]ETN20370.1 hypothetical protein PPTG_03393 [Phytophthora nicotianae INRA-310]